MFHNEQLKLLAAEVLVHLEYADKCVMIVVTTCSPLACHFIFLIQDILRKMYWIIGRKSQLSLANKLLCLQSNTETYLDLSYIIVGICIKF